MTVLANGDIWTIKSFCGNAARNQLGINVFHFDVTSVVGLPSDGQLATEFDSVWAPVIKGVLSADCIYYGCGVTRTFPGPATPLKDEQASSGAGTFGATALPNQVTGIISWLTAFAGRKYRGRSYLPFPPITAETPEVPSAAYVAATAALGAVIIGFAGGTSGFNTINGYMGVYHRLSNSIDRITDARLRRKWATQRRRGDYGRQNAFPF